MTQFIWQNPFYAGGGLGEAGFWYKKAFFENLPIPRSDKQQIQSVEKSNNDEEISIQLGKIYGFSPTEIDYIARKVDELNEEAKGWETSRLQSFIAVTSSVRAKSRKQKRNATPYTNETAARRPPRTTAGTASNSPNARCPTDGTAKAGVWTNDIT